MVEKLAVEAAGAFRLAKVNVDDNPGLSARFGVQSIPMLKAFHEAKVVAQLVGAQPESAVRKFLREVAPGPAERALAEAAGWLTARRWTEAEQSARRALELDRGSSAAALCLIKALLWQGKGSQALEQIGQFPAGNEDVSAQRLQPLAALLAEAASSADRGGGRPRSRNICKRRDCWRGATIPPRSTDCWTSSGATSTIATTMRARFFLPRWNCSERTIPLRVRTGTNWHRCCF